MASPNELRVFISSTFRDLQQEREHLVKRIFPEIRALCRQRGVTFTEVDLRWGLTEEEGTLGRVIRICLEEVDRCHPYFIGLLGSSYGWVPDVHEVYMDVNLLREYPWVEGAVERGISVTEMEVIEGVFSGSELADVVDPSVHAHFYQQRHPNDVAVDPRLRVFVERVRRAALPLRTFTDLDELGRYVRDDLVALIDGRWPQSDAPDPLAIERRAHAAFAASRTRAGIPRMEYSDALDAWSASGSAPMVVVGESGIGKSSILASFAESFRRHHQNALVIEHYVGVSDRSTTAAGTIEHILGELRSRFSFDDPIPSDPDELESCLGAWLQRASTQTQASGEPILLIIDALNQIDERSWSMLWLPDSIPPDVRLVVSTTPGAVEEQLRGRNWDRLDVGSIDAKRVRQSMVVRYLGEYRKGISPEHLLALTSDDKAASPLFLRVVSEELRLHGEHESLSEAVERYASAPDIQTVFQRVLERIERDFGRSETERLLALIACSRSGLSEHELLVLTGAARIDLSHILFSLDYHLLHRNGLLDFFHTFLSDAVRVRYLSELEVEREYHRAIAEYFSTEPYGERRVHEEPWQWMATGAVERVCECIRTIPMTRAFMQQRAKYELIGYWRRLAGRFDIGKEYLAELKQYEASHGDRRELIEVLHELGDLFIAADRYDAADTVYEQEIEIARTEFADDLSIEARALDDLGVVRAHQGRHVEAESIFRRVMEIREVVADSDVERCGAMDNLATVLYGLGRYDECERICRHSLELCERQFGRNHLQTADRLHNLAAAVGANGDQDAALELMRRGLEIQRRALGDAHPATAKTLMNLGALSYNAGDYGTAEECGRAVLATHDAGLGDARLVGQTLYMLAIVAMTRAEYSEARALLERAVSVQSSALGPYHAMTVRSCITIGRTLSLEGRDDEAFEWYSRYFPMLEESLGADNPITVLERENYETVRRNLAGN